LLKQQYFLANFCLKAEIGLPWGNPANFNRFASWLHYCSDVAHRIGQPNFARSLAVSWAGTLYIYILGAFAPDGILSGAKFTLRPSLGFSYLGSVTARHSNSRRKPNFAARYKEWNYATFADGATYIRLGGHHVGHRPTF